VDDLAGLLGLVEIGAVELHAWNATVDHLEQADVLVFDLDPGASIEWEFVTETALLLREMLTAEGLESWPKLTGGKGVHVMAPLQTRMSHDEAHRYSRAIAEKISRTQPERFTTTAATGARSGRLFIDYLRNGRGTTAVATFSPRARPGFPIAAPVSWNAIEHDIRPDAFTMAQPFPQRRADRAARRVSRSERPGAPRIRASPAGHGSRESSRARRRYPDRR
jgi:bifunctional non-homologous end joining protein LigD